MSLNLSSLSELAQARGLRVLVTEVTHPGAVAIHSGDSNELHAELWREAHQYCAVARYLEKKKDKESNAETLAEREKHYSSPSLVAVMDLLAQHRKRYRAG